MKENAYSAYVELDLDTVEPCISGPKRCVILVHIYESEYSPRSFLLSLKVAFSVSSPLSFLFKDLLLGYRRCVDDC